MTRDEKHNAICNIAGESLWGFMSAMVAASTVLVVLLSSLGASNRVIGLIPTIDGASLLLQMVGIYLFRSHKSRKWRMALWHYAPMIPGMALCGVLILARERIEPSWLPMLLLASWALYVGSIGVIGAAWQDWIAHLFHERIRGLISGLSWGLSSLAGVGGMLLAGWALRRFPSTDTYGWLYVAAAILAAMSITVFLFIRDPAEQLETDHAPHVHEMIAAAKHSVRDRNFRAILVGRCLAVAGFCVGPFIAKHYSSPDGGNLSAATIVSLGAAQTLGGAASCIGFGKIGDHVGHRFGVLAGCSLQIACLLALLFVPGAIGCFLAFLFAGAVGGTLIISYTNMVIESCPHDIRSAHLMIGNVAVGAAWTVLPLLGSQLAEAYGIRTLAGWSLLLSVVATAWIVLRVRDPRKLRKRTAPPVAVA